MEKVICGYIEENESINRSHKKWLQVLIVCFYFLIAFFEPYLNGVVGSITKYYIFFLAFCIFISEKPVEINWFVLPFFFWFALKVISLVNVDNLYVYETHINSHIGMLMLLFVFGTITPSDYLIDSIILTELVGSAIIGVLSLFFKHPYHGTVSERQVLFIFGQEADPNNQAAFLLVGIAVALYYIFKKKHIAISCVTILINAYSCFLTGSRGGFLGMLCIGLIFIFACIREYRLKSLKWIAATVIIVSIIYIVTVNYLPKDISERVFGFKSYEGGSDRDVIWSNAWELFSSDANFLFGAGWGAYYGYNGLYFAVHNTFLSVLCDVGILGFLLFFIPITIMGGRLWKARCYSPVFITVASFVPSFFIEAINKRFFWNAIFLLLICYINIFQNEKGGNEI